MDDSVGQSINRVDGPTKVTGSARYAYEHRVANAAYGVLVTSGIAKGRIATMNTQAAERAPGVLLVMTHGNAPKLPAVPPKNGPGGHLQLLQDDRIFYANQPIGVVVADTFQNAMSAAQLVDVLYAEEAPQVDLESRIAEGFTPEEGKPRQRGNIADGLNRASARVEQVYSTPFEVHNPMEPHATVAVWDRPDHLTLYDATQGVFMARARVASLFGIPEHNVRVISPYLGGAFGSKGPVWSHVMLCAMAARQAKRPVKLAVRRPQMFGMLGCRSETRQAVALGAKPDGTLTAVHNDTVSHTSTFDEFVEQATAPARMLYSSESNATSQKLVKSDIGTPSYMRAPGEASGNYALESAMDELAYALKMDPVELRLKNHADTDPESNLPWSSKSLKECYRRGAERFGWAKRSPEPRSMREGNFLIGWGMATSAYPTNRSTAHASARLNADGTFSVDAGTQDLGTGTYTIMTQIAAEAFGVAPKKVKFRLGDTVFPETPISGGSQTAASTGSAVYLASQALKEKLVQMALRDSQSPLSGSSAEDIAFENGRMFSRSNPGKGETFQALIARSGQPHVQASASTQPGEMFTGGSEGTERERYSMYAFGAQFAEVRVDADLGMIKVSRMTGCFAAGRILNAKTARSQFLGGMVWGASMALYEHAAMDKRLGRWVNNNLSEYLVPVNADIGDIEVLWVDEKDDRVNAIGAKGIGEIGITGAAAAVANAVYHATGVRVRDLPITLDKVLQLA